MTDLTEVERKKYETVWGEYPAYRRQADGDPVVDQAFQLMGCKPKESLIDWGCGKGTPALKFQQLGLRVRGVDIAWNCRDEEARSVPLTVACLWDLPKRLIADYAFSTDVLEHIPPEHLDKVLRNIYERTRRRAFFQVCTTYDTFGSKHMNPPQRLHLSVMSALEWKARLEAVGWKIMAEGNQGKSRWWAVCSKSVIK